MTGTDELTGFEGGRMMGVVEGTSTGAAGLTGVTVTGFVAGTVTVVGEEVYGEVVGTAGVVGFVGKIVGEPYTSCEVVFGWGSLRISLLEEGRICSSSLLSSFCAKSSMESTSAYNPTSLLVIRVSLSKAFETLSVNSATSVALGAAGLLIVKTMGTALQGRTE